MAKRKPAKMQSSDAVKVLANELNSVKTVIKQMGADLNGARGFLNEIARVLESYIQFEGNVESFTEYMKKLAEESKNDKEGNESSDGQDPSDDTSDEGVGAKGVRS